MHKDRKKSYNMKRIIIAIFILSSISLLSAQRGFKGSATVGFSANQIDGDALIGYHKLGLTAGVSLFYPLNKKLDLGLELLYTQRGSSPQAYDNVSGIHLDYLEVPLVIRIKDWYYEEDDFYKVYAEGGLSAAYLFNVDTDSDLFNGTIGGFNKMDLSIILGIGYNFNKRWGMGIRYTRSLFPIYGDVVFQGTYAIAYNFNLKIYYHF